MVPTASFYLTLLTSVFLLSSSHGQTGLLYETDFESFPVGDNQWNGQDGWFSNTEAASGGIQGIDSGLVVGLGKTAFIGSKRPTTTFNFVSREIGHDPAETNSASVEIETLIGFEDSTNGRYDSFFVTIYNHSQEFLAALQFSNQRSAFGIFYDNGITVKDSNFDYVFGELYLLTLEIDFQNNRIDARLDGIPLFEESEVPFTETGRSRNFGFLSYEWLISSSDPALYGNNWMLVAETKVTATPQGVETPMIAEFNQTSAGSSLSFLGEPGWTYQVQYSDGLNTWKDDLPSSTFVNPDSAKMLTFTDSSSAPSALRFYRVQRTVTP